MQSGDATLGIFSDASNGAEIDKSCGIFELVRWIGQISAQCEYKSILDLVVFILNYRSWPMDHARQDDPNADGKTAKIGKKK